MFPAFGGADGAAVSFDLSVLLVRRKLCLIRALRALQAGAAARTGLAPLRRSTPRLPAPRSDLQPSDRSTAGEQWTLGWELMRDFAKATPIVMGGLTAFGLRPGDVGSSGRRVAKASGDVGSSGWKRPFRADAQVMGAVAIRAAPHLGVRVAALKGPTIPAQGNTLLFQGVRVPALKGPTIPAQGNALGRVAGPCVAPNAGAQTRPDRNPPEPTSGPTAQEKTAR